MDTRPECENKNKTKKEKAKKGKAQNIKLKIIDYVMVKKGRFVGYYACKRNWGVIWGRAGNTIF